MNLLALSLAASVLVQVASAVDVPFSLLVSQEAVISFDIKVEYRSSTQSEFVPYASCDGSDDCTALNWDDDAELRLTITPPTREAIAAVAVTRIKDEQLENPPQPMQYKIEACFETPFTKNRKWRKPKDVIQDDKRCAKKVVGKRDLPTEQVQETFRIKSDSPDARFFLTVFVFCKVAGEDKTEHCAIDTTGRVQDLAKLADVKKRLKEAGQNTDNLDDAYYARFDERKSDMFSYRTATIDSRPPQLIASVVVLSVISVSMLVLYFVYERVLKKTA